MTHHEQNGAIVHPIKPNGFNENQDNSLREWRENIGAKTFEIVSPVEAELNLRA